VEQDSEAGTIMVDALVAVVIVSLMIAACLVSLNLSHRLSAEARQTRQARLVLTALLEVAPHVPGQYNGTRDGLPYRVTVTADGDSNLCRIEAETVGRRVYRLRASRWCHAEAGA
jgi:hypothetical protein